MQLNAEMGSMMNERFNVAGAMLAKLYGRPRDESGLFANRAARVRDIAMRGLGVRTGVRHRHGHARLADSLHWYTASAAVLVI